MGSKIVYIKDVKYRGKTKKIVWKKIEKELKKYVGKIVIVDENKKEVYIGNDFPDEFTGSKYTAKLQGALIKVKANMSSIIIELVKNAHNAKYEKNKKDLHSRNAKYGWEKYDVNFAIPILDDNGKFVYYNYYVAKMIVRLSANGKNYLYDFVEIKKETRTPIG